MTSIQIKALRALASLIIESAIAAGDRGLISGHLYAVLMGKLSLDQYQQVMAGMVKAGMLTESGHVYHATDKARQLCVKKFAA